MQANAKPPKAGPSFVVRLLIVLGGIFLLFAIIGVVLSLLGGGKGDQEQFSVIASEQQSLSALSSSAVQGATSESAKAFALNVQLTMQTNLNQTKAYMSSAGIKLDEKQLAAATDQKSLQELDAAKETTNYDQTARDVLERALISHATTLKTAYNAAEDVQTKQLLSQAFQTTGSLIEQNKAATE